eukprot:Gb_23714 [translate_table: standard]
MRLYGLPQCCTDYYSADVIYSTVIPPLTGSKSSQVANRGCPCANIQLFPLQFAYRGLPDWPDQFVGVFLSISDPCNSLGVAHNSATSHSLAASLQINSSPISFDFWERRHLQTRNDSSMAYAPPQCTATTFPAILSSHRSRATDIRRPTVVIKWPQGSTGFKRPQYKPATSVTLGSSSKSLNRPEQHLSTSNKSATSSRWDAGPLLNIFFHTKKSPTAFFFSHGL